MKPRPTSQDANSVKPLSMLWALALGLLAVVIQVILYGVRFGGWNPYAGFPDYLSFFLAGSAGGILLLLGLNRQVSRRGRWIVLSVFLLASPIALVMMLGGGLFGPFGVLILPQIPWAIAAWFGSWIGRRFAGV